MLSLFKRAFLKRDAIFTYFKNLLKYCCLALVVAFIAIFYWKGMAEITVVLANLKVEKYPVGHVLVSFWLLGWSYLTYRIFVTGLRN